ncbi:MAG: AMP-binding protein, partial [Deltaproteobacteria bacterium]
MSDLQKSLDTYRRRVERFRWEIPDTFNFGRDVVDHFAQEASRPALVWRDAAGSEQRLGFGAIRSRSNRVAHLLGGLGIQPGDPVIVMLPRVPEWQQTLVGALKAGALVIPSSTILRPKDIAYRAQHSGAKVIVSIGDQTTAVDAVRQELSGVHHFLSLGAPGKPAPDGWTDFRAALAREPDDDGATRSTRASDPALVYYTSGTT